MNLLLSLALLQSAPQLVIGLGPAYRTVGQFSCEIRDAQNELSRVTGRIIDFEKSADGGKDEITIELEAPKESLLSGTYFGWVDGEIIIFRNWVNHDSHLVMDVSRDSTLLLWGNPKQGGTLSVSARIGDYETEGYAGLCDIEFRRERITSKP
jgi:hypothetical protein